VIVSVAGLSFLGFRLAGQQLVGLAPRQHRALRGIMVGLVPQDPFAACDPLRPVRDHLDEAWRAHARRPEPGEVDGLLIDVGLDPARTRARPHQWSGGMLQRATIAAATAHRPALVVADEPTSALDAALREEILEVLHARSRSLLLISHDLTLVAGHAETVAVCYAGRIVEVGSVAEVLTAPRHPYTRALLAAVPRPRHSPPRPLPGAPPDLTDPPIGCAFASRCPLVEDHCRVEEPQIRDGVACPVVTR
ncbi:MAG: oligopeptide/dipeptide ABC transporter ATP-binding protein, partial [Actinomycetes bacterium]